MIDRWEISNEELFKCDMPRLKKKWEAAGWYSWRRYSCTHLCTTRMCVRKLGYREGFAPSHPRTDWTNFSFIRETAARGRLWKEAEATPCRDLLKAQVMRGYRGGRDWHVDREMWYDYKIMSFIFGRSRAGSCVREKSGNVGWFGKVIWPI